MQENSFLLSEEPQQQHQGEGAQGISVADPFHFNTDPDPRIRFR